MSTESDDVMGHSTCSYLIKYSGCSVIATARIDCFTILLSHLTKYFWFQANYTRLDLFLDVPFHLQYFLNDFVIVQVAAQLYLTVLTNSITLINLRDLKLKHMGCKREQIKCTLKK